MMWRWPMILIHLLSAILSLVIVAWLANTLFQQSRQRCLRDAYQDIDLVITSHSTYLSLVVNILFLMGIVAMEADLYHCRATNLGIVCLDEPFWIFYAVALFLTSVSIIMLTQVVKNFRRSYPFFKYRLIKEIAYNKEAYTEVERQMMIEFLNGKRSRKDKMREVKNIVKLKKEKNSGK